MKGYKNIPLDAGRESLVCLKGFTSECGLILIST